MPVALTVKKIDGKPGKVYYPLQLKEVPKPSPGPKEVLVRLNAAALNHRDLFVRQQLYPGISFEHPLLADGHGTVIQSGPQCVRNLQGKDVLLFPARGWDAHPDGPEDIKKYRKSVIGGTAMYDAGTAQEYIVCSEEDVEVAPEHLSAIEGAALPLVGLTGWRALVTKTGENASRGRNILITGIGGGVALQVLQFAVELGCNAWVTSGDKAKIEKAVKLGAKGGVSYRDKDWDKQLQKSLPKERPFLDAVIDGAGGDIVARATKLLKPGGIISQYGMTTAPTMPWGMQAVLKNVELRGSTMGSRAEFRDMVAFVRERPLLKPVISRVAKGLKNLDGIDELFADMKDGKQFGKLVIDISSGAASSSKL